MKKPIEGTENEGTDSKDSGNKVPEKITSTAVETDISPDALLPFAMLRMNDPVGEETDADALLAEIHGKLDDEKIDALIDSCMNECLQVVVRPLGVGKVLFEDKEGGNVDTIHNVRDNIYATDSAREAYENRGEYDDMSKPYNERTKNIVHSGSKYIEVNKRNSETRKNGGIKDGYADATRTVHDKVDLDHVNSAKQTHDDRGRVLSKVSTQDAANIVENLLPTDASINRSKGKKSPEEFAQWLEDTAPQRKNKIADLASRDDLSDKDRKELDKLRKLDQADPNAVREQGKKARASQDTKINKAYYTGYEFLSSTAATSAKEGGKMALQQAIGLLMEEFIRGAFAEVRDAWQNGFKGKVDDDFFDALKTRLMRVAKRVQKKWKDAAFAFKDGFLSGFLSNIVTVLINTFVTTAARTVRIIREGSMSLYQACKIVIFPKEGMTLADAADAATKLIASGLIVGGGIVLEEALDPYLTIFGPAQPYVSAIVAGIVTGLCTAFIIYMLDQLDLFGVNAKTRQEQIVSRLNESIKISHERGIEAAAIFDDPLLPHLK